jgi:thiamine biosynthesis lipoprotein
MRMGAKPGAYRLPADAKPMMDFYRQLYEVTDGLVTPLIGRTLEQAGYDAAYSFKIKELASPPAWDEALAYAYPDLTIKQSVVLDFGAAGKGYLVDLVGELLRHEGIMDFCINAGGDMLSAGSPLRVGLENPDNEEEAVGIFELKDGALCGSAGNRRRWAGFHHTINPKTLQSPAGIKAIWVQAATAMHADGLATALYFTDPARLRKHFPFEYAMIKDDEVTASPGFKAEFFS